ncbi:MFS transporter [Patulibacter defluvii]|uniref:MFS transporter n=1 Tax=Patulibacter defluvii TaxID=3095358 RepID=UPI002A75512E|nr:MFS transporter [Patulibacter sp. DM4]
MTRRTLALLAICGGSFLAFLDATIVNVSFPDIRRSFDDASNAQLSWILDAYFIVLAAFLVPAGGIADRLGRKRVFLVSTGAFVAASALCAIAPSWQTLIAARVLQGLAAAVMVPVSLALLLPLFPVERRAAGIGIWGAAAALAAAFGPPLGGVLVEIADWRWIFLVNLPLGALVLVAGVRALDESRDEHASGLPDLVASALSAIGLGLLALAIVEGNSWGWGAPRTLAAAAVALLLTAIVVRRCLTHPRPLVDPALLRIPSFRWGNLGTLLFSMAFFSTILGNILFLTGVWQYSVLHAGLATVPGPLMSAIVAGPAGRLADRFGHRAVIVPGTLLYAAGLLILRGAGAEPDYLGTWLPGMSLTGLGIGLAFPILGAAAAADITPDRFGIASAVTGAFRQFGAVLGTAILIAIVGEPRTLAAAGAAADDAYLFGIGTALAAGLAALALRRPAPVAVEEPAAPPAPVALGR